MLPYLYKALGLALQEKDVLLEKALMGSCELLGRFVLPDTLIPLIEPRLREDPLETPYGLDEKQKAVVLTVLRALIEGARPQELFKHLATLMDLYTEEEAELCHHWQASARGVDSLLRIVKGRGKTAVEAHFLSTGRLTTLNKIFYRAFSYLMVCRGRGRYLEGDATLVRLADEGLTLLQGIEEEGHDHDDCMGANKGVSALIWRHGPSLVKETIDDYLTGSLWSETRIPHLLLQEMLEWDPGFLYDHIASLVGLACHGLMRAEDAGCKEDILVSSLGHWLATAFNVVGVWVGKEEGRVKSCDPSTAIILESMVYKVVMCCAEERLWTKSRHRLEIRLDVVDAMTKHGRWCWNTTAKGGETMAEVIAWHVMDCSADVMLRKRALETAGSFLSLFKPSGRLRNGHVPPEGCRFRAGRLCTAMLQRLDDGDAGVRELACEALHVMLYFLSWEGELGGGGRVESYGSLLHACLSKYLPDPQAAIREGLDSLVRMVAVAEPCRFLDSVQGFMSTHKKGEAMDDLFHALLDHGETLLALYGSRPPSSS